MPRRPLGQTGLEVSVLGFGASPLGGVFQVRRCVSNHADVPLSRPHRPPLAEGSAACRLPTAAPAAAAAAGD